VRKESPVPCATWREGAGSIKRKRIKMFCDYQPTYEDLVKIRKATAKRKLQGKIESLKMLIKDNPDLATEMKRQIKIQLLINDSGGA
jgi:hypothetical protein